MLASVACFTAVMIGFASGASAVSVPMETKATAQSAKSSNYSYVDYTSDEFSSIATADEATDIAEKLLQMPFSAITLALSFQHFTLMARKSELQEKHLPSAMR